MAEENSEISNYEFKNFSSSDNDDGAVHNYSFKNLDKINPALAERNGNKAKFERLSAEKRNFIISPIVSAHRGLLVQEKEERERKILGEVQRRVEIIKEQAYQDGFAEGVKA